jgi:hypothetical protein
MTVKQLRKHYGNVRIVGDRAEYVDWRGRVVSANVRGQRADARHGPR